MGREVRRVIAKPAEIDDLGDAGTLGLRAPVLAAAIPRAAFDAWVGSSTVRVERPCRSAAAHGSC
ncbi:MAG TPA: hypothetical protein VFX51_10045 [Solirubrobacteraceae bacterium]|nr:hypothetical protein [Solirubrobacteraceae bacterium]